MLWNNFLELNLSPKNIVDVERVKKKLYNNTASISMRKLSILR